MINLINIILCALAVLIVVFILTTAVALIQTSLYGYIEQRKQHKKIMKRIDVIFSFGKEDE